ncbi:MAG: hypothetical protein R2822_15345 [Spirosomataceae bacterium]
MAHIKADNQLVTWQNIYYHYAKWSSDGSFEKLFSSTHQIMKASLALECIQLDGSHTPSKKGGQKVKYQKRKKVQNDQ